MAVDALGPCVSRSSAAKILTTQYKQVLVIHKKEFQLPAQSECQEMLENAIFLFPQNHSEYKRLSYTEIVYKLSPRKPTVFSVTCLHLWYPSLIIWRSDTDAESCL